MKSRYALPDTEHLFVSLHKKWIVSATTRVSRAAREEHIQEITCQGKQKLIFFKVLSRWNPFWEIKCSQISHVMRFCYISLVLTKGHWDSHSIVVKHSQKSTLHTSKRGNLIVSSDILGDPVEAQLQALPPVVDCLVFQKASFLLNALFNLISQIHLKVRLIMVLLWHISAKN